MTDVSFNVPPLPFPSLESQQQAQAGDQAVEPQRQFQQDATGCRGPRLGIVCDTYLGERFIPRGTPAADLANLFPKAQL